jgi:cell division protein FtsB
MKKFIKFIGYFRNFYVLTGTVAFIWILFFDRYSLIERIETEVRIQRLEADVQFYRDEKLRLEEQRLVLENDLDELERYARERYHMKKENEDLFLLVRNSDED